MDFSRFSSRPYTRFAREYLARPLRGSYADPANRLFLYFLLTAFFMIGVLLGLVVYKGPMVLVHKMAFTTVYSVHVALAYAFCHWAVDIAASRVWREWGGYVHRTVGRHWLIWVFGFFLGFALHRTFLLRLVYLYAPEVVEHYSSAPQTKPSHLAYFFVALPTWFGAVFLTTKIALGKGQAVQTNSRPGAGQLVYGPDSEVVREYKKARRPQKAAPGLSSPGSLVVTVDARSMEIPLGRISHITVEDHYSRIFFSNGADRNNVLIRSPLKDLLQKLPRDRFFQIHRSHVVNLDYVSALKKKGRKAKLTLGRSGIELPVSRYRLPQIRSILKDIPEH